MESFLFRKKNTLLDYTEPQLLPFVAPVCDAEVSIKLFFFKIKELGGNYMTTTWQARLAVESCLFLHCQSNNDIWSTRQAPEYSFWALGLQVLLSLWASKNLKITDMCSSQIFKDLSASCKQFLSLAFSLQMKFFSHISNDGKEFLQTSYLPHP